MKMPSLASSYHCGSGRSANGTTGGSAVLMAAPYEAAAPVIRPSFAGLSTIRIAAIRPSDTSNTITSQTLPARLQKLKKDPWAGFFGARQSLTKAMIKKLG